MTISIDAYFNPNTGAWQAVRPAMTYSDQRLALHRRVAVLQPCDIDFEQYPTLASIQQAGDDEPTYRFSGTFWAVFRDVFNMACQRVHINNRQKGFWPNNDSPQGSLRLALYPDTHGRNVGEALALMTSEHSESLDAYREGGLDKMDDKLPNRSGQFTEVVDAIIRGCDWLGGLMADAGTIMVEKLTYNKDARGHLHGKRF